MARGIRDPRERYLVILIRDGAELDRAVVLADSEEDAKSLAQADLGRRNHIGLFDDNVEYREEKI
jgi:hypothetical protein